MTPAAPQFLTRVISPSRAFAEPLSGWIPAFFCADVLLGTPLEGQGSYSISSWPHTVVAIGSGLQCFIFDSHPCLVLSTQLHGKPCTRSHRHNGKPHTDTAVLKHTVYWGRPTGIQFSTVHAAIQGSTGVMGACRSAPGLVLARYRGGGDFPASPLRQEGP